MTVTLDIAQNFHMLKMVSNYENVIIAMLRRLLSSEDIHVYKIE